jgi:hypothetical protein
MRLLAQRIDANSLESWVLHGLWPRCSGIRQPSLANGLLAIHGSDRLIIE